MRLIHQYLTTKFSVIKYDADNNILTELHGFETFAGAAAFFIETVPQVDPGDSLILDTGDDGGGTVLARYIAPEAETAATMPLTDKREIAAVLAGLRLVQQSEVCFPPGIDDILTECGAFDQLDNIEIDDLCERINS